MSSATGETPVASYYFCIIVQMKEDSCFSSKPSEHAVGVVNLCGLHGVCVWGERDVPSQSTVSPLLAWNPTSSVGPEGLEASSFSSLEECEFSRLCEEGCKYQGTASFHLFS